MMVLIVFSVALLAEELTLPEGSLAQERSLLLQEGITILFVIELSIRYVAMRHRRRFLQEYWVDIVAVLPLFRVFRVFRFLRLLRLLRLFRLTHLLTANTRLFQFLLRRRVAEHVLTGLLLMFTLVFGTLGMSMFEHGPATGVDRLVNSFWATIFSLVAGEYVVQYPLTTGGKLVSLFVQFCGLGFFALVTGTVSAVMIEKLREGAVLKRIMLEELENHVLICGWNSGVEMILMELQNHPTFRERDYIVVAQRDELPEMQGVPNPGRVHLVNEDFTRVEVLRRCAVRAGVAIIVSDVAQGRTRQDADARTVLAALTIEKLNPEVYTCAELSNAMNEPHLRMGGVNEVILTRDLAGHLLAQAALHSANVAVLQELLSPTSGSTVHPLPVAPELIGEEFGSILSQFRDQTGSIPIAVQCSDGRVMVNPDHHRLQAGDLLLCVGSPHRKRP
ncbi:MAG: ion transporter [Armatimonadetes bacterium]|nr:ion transporter [Armatimonadota bacterium]